MHGEFIFLHHDAASASMMGDRSVALSVNKGRNSVIADDTAERDGARASAALVAGADDSAVDKAGKPSEEPGKLWASAKVVPTEEMAEL